MEATSLNGYYFKDKNGRTLIETETNNRTQQYNQLKSQLDNLIEKGLVPYAVDSTSDMTNTKRIYVLKSTGKWYYYDTDTLTWTIGGDYQATTSTDSLTTQLNTKFPSSVDLTTLTWINGGVNPSTHELTNGDIDRIRNKTYLYVKAGSVITFSSFATYSYKLTLYKHIPKFGRAAYISEPVSFASETATYTFPYDCFIVITIKKKDGSEIQDDFSTLVALLSSSTIVEGKLETPYDENLNLTLGYVSGKEIQSAGNLASNDNSIVFFEIPVNPKEMVGYFTTEYGSTQTGRNMQVAMYDKDGVFISGTSILAGSGCIGSVAPDEAKFCLVGAKVYSDINNLSIKKFKFKDNNYQNNIRLLGDGTRVKLIAHRGLEKFAPEATIPAYTIAGEKGMYACKLDICETYDGVFVMSHDVTLTRVFGINETIAEQTYDHIKDYVVVTGNNVDIYNNEHIVKFEDALDICKKYNMAAVIEMKHINNGATSVANILSILKAKGMLQKTLCQCSEGDRQYIYYLRSQNSIIPILYWQERFNEASVKNLMGLTNQNHILNAWNSGYDTDANITAINNANEFYCCAVADGANALNKTLTAISHGAVYIVTDQVTPADIAPETYSV